MGLRPKHEQEPPRDPWASRETEQPVTKPAPKDTGDVCTVCGRRGRPDGHH